ncbi:MAG: hypothetical protein ACRC8S_12645 [Fimbriiglobus sp.]
MHSIMRRLCFSLLVIVPLTLLGCSSEGAKGTVNGTVTLDGTPLKEGVVNFTSADGKGGSTSGTIKDGSFTATVPVGEMKVAFSASKVIGKKKMYDTPDSPTVDDTIELIPEKYNTNTILKLTVKSGTQSEKYDLKSK